LHGATFQKLVIFMCQHICNVILLLCWYIMNYFISCKLAQLFIPVFLCLLAKRLTLWLWELFSICNLALQWKTPYYICFSGVDKHFQLCRTGVGCRYIKKNKGVEWVKIRIIMLGMSKDCLFLGRRLWLLAWTFKYFSCVLCVSMAWVLVIWVIGFWYEEYFFSAFSSSSDLCWIDCFYTGFFWLCSK